VGSHNHSVQLLGQGILRWSFPNIMLPDSNINEPLSHGFVTFRIRPRLPLLPGDEIENIANIYFDYNPPVITEPSVLVASTGTVVVEAGSGAHLQLMPNPTDGSVQVHVIGDAPSQSMLYVRGLDGRVHLAHRMPGALAVMDVSALAAGVYMVECHTNNGLRHVARLVKQVAR
jgi:hypothetical protein